MSLRLVGAYCLIFVTACAPAPEPATGGVPPGLPATFGSGVCAVEIPTGASSGGIADAYDEARNCRRAEARRINTQHAEGRLSSATAAAAMIGLRADAYRDTDALHEIFRRLEPTAQDPIRQRLEIPGASELTLDAPTS
ncbi:MAG: hypothetical protein AAF409_07825 [Pseudomonadota bacterium]